MQASSEERADEAAAEDAEQVAAVGQDRRRAVLQQEPVAQERAPEPGREREDEDADEVVTLAHTGHRAGDREQERGGDVERDWEVERGC